MKKKLQIKTYLNDPGLESIIEHSCNSLNLSKNKSIHQIIILDTTLSRSDTNKILDHKPPGTIVLLALQSNYTNYLNSPLPKSIDGLIYKPFNILELRQTIANISQYPT